jgi:linoleoyl-CoA desaturase
MDPMTKLRSFRQELADRGFLERTPCRIVAELAIFVAATLVGIGLLLLADNLVVKAFAMWLITLAAMGVSTNAHTASHNAASKKRWVNQAITYFGLPFFLQLSVTYWRHKHIVIHHPQPNVAGVDDDADLMPLFAVSEEDLVRASPWRRTLYRYQAIYLPVLLLFNSYNVAFHGWRFLCRKLIDRNERRPKHWLDLAMLLAHWTVWIALPMLFLPALDVIAFTLARFTLLSYGMYALFAPAHFPAEAAMVRADAVDDFVALQTLTTVNYRTGWLGRLICGGVEYQIEHHLFPAISPAHYPKLSKLVAEYCQRNGYPYRSFGWGEAIWKSLVAFTKPKPVHANFERAVAAVQSGDGADPSQTAPEAA